MDRPWAIIGWSIILAVILFTLFFVGVIAKVFVDDWWFKYRLKRAHAGKIRCEEKMEQCKRIATHRTPNGFFCRDHAPKNSKQPTLSGSVSWHHILNHTLKGN